MKTVMKLRICSRLSAEVSKTSSANRRRKMKKSPRFSAKNSDKQKTHLPEVMTTIRRNSEHDRIIVLQVTKQYFLACTVSLISKHFLKAAVYRKTF